MRAGAGLVALAGAILPALAGSSFAGALPGRVVLMPPENISAAATGTDFLAAALSDRLEVAGWEVADPVAVENILRAARARRVDSLSGEVRRWLFEETGASATLFSTVETWLEGENAIVAFSARLVGDDGTPLWSALASASAREIEGALGFRRTQDGSEVARQAAEALTRDLPRPGAGETRPDRRARPLHAARPTTFRSATLAREAHLRIFLTPFANLSASREASRQLTAPVARRLTASGLFEVLEPAEFRAALLAEKVPSADQLDAARMRDVATRLGTPYYVRGAVWRWREGNPQSAAVTPEVELELELVDAESERVLWATHHARAGKDYEGFLLRGAIGSAVALADQALAEMVDDLLDAKATGAPRPVVPFEKPESGPPLGEARR